MIRNLSAAAVGPDPSSTLRNGYPQGTDGHPARRLLRRRRAGRLRQVHSRSSTRNPVIKDAVHDLLKNRDGLMLGICNGFQALVKLGLVPYGEIVPTWTDALPHADLQH